MKKGALRRRNAQAERNQRVRTLWLAGVKGEAIAAEVGISREYLRKKCRALGLPRRDFQAAKPSPRPALTDEVAAKVFDLWDEGNDTMRIAALLTKTEAAVYNTLARRARL